MKPIYKMNDQPIFLDRIGVLLDDALDFDKNVTILDPSILDKINQYNLDFFISDKIFTCNPLSQKHQSIDSGCYLFFSIECNTNQDIAFYVLNSNPDANFWVDGELLDRTIPTNFHTLSLAQGYHIFVWKCSQFPKDSCLQVRINSLQNDKKDLNTSWLHGNLILNEPKFNLIDLSEEIDKNKVAKFYIACGNRLITDYERGVELRIVKYPSNELLEERVCYLNEVVTIDMTMYESNEYIVLVWKCWDRIGRAIERADPYYFGNKRKQLQDISEKVKRILNKGLSVQEDAFLNKLLIDINNRLKTNDIHVCYNYEFDKNIYDIEYGIYKRKLNAPGWVVGVVPSSLDNKPVQFKLFIPYGYDPSKKYPIIVRYATYFGVSTVHCFDFDKWDKSFVLDIDAGGVTFGSYIGEALFLETLNYVLNEYPINKNLVFGSGFCAGSSGIFAIAEENPDIFAALAVYWGVFNASKTNNLSNIPIIHFDSKYQASMLDYAKLFSNNLDYELHYVDDFGHQILETISLNTVVLDRLLSHAKNTSPKEIDFTTSSLRHNKSYWVTVNSFVTYNEPGRIIVKIRDNSINIATTNVSSFSLNLPSYASGYYLIIDGNNTGKIYANDNNHYIKSSQRFIKSEKAVTHPMYEGSGLLDVYHTPMMVINCVPNDVDAQQAATSLANPSNNSYRPYIYVSYPIVSCVPKDIKTQSSHSFIVIDSNVNSPYLNELRDRCRAKMSPDGYRYGDTEYNGDYCIMEVLSNPENDKYSILYINTNNTKLLKQNLVTRKMIIPTYVNGKHPILNSNIYIFKRERVLELNS